MYAQASQLHDRHPRPPQDAPLVADGLAGLWPPLRREPLAFMCRAAREYGDVLRFRLGPLRPVLVSSPDGAQRVLVDHHRNYDKQTRGYRTLSLFLGNGLLTSEGDFWRRQRRIAQPAFHRQRIASFATTMVDLTAAMVQRWAGRDRVDMETEMTSLTLRIVAKTLLSADIEDQGSRIGTAVTALNAFARSKMANPLSVPASWPTPRNLRFRAMARSLDEVVMGIIEERRRDPEATSDLLSMLMTAKDTETGESMSDQQLRDEAMTIFVAGHETTANTLAWTFYLLSRHPDVARRVRAELAEVLGGRLPTLEDLPRLELLARVVKESLRLYPPAWSIGRRSVGPDVIDGCRIRANTLVVLAPWVTHRHPRYWSNPEGFDPERFTPEAEKERPRYAYFPFGGGPRQCIGNGFAAMEAQLVLATVLPRYEPSVVPGHPIVPEPMITLRPKYGMPMSVRRLVDGGEP